ncbi:hypothetical protein ACSMXN_09210 [Jatrophihabitans sp. DSM 45814]
MNVIDQCQQCGGVDDHPKVRIGDAFGSGVVMIYHLDCLPHEMEQSFRADPNFGHLRAAAIDAAKDGTHGDELRAVLVSQDAEQQKIIDDLNAAAEAANTAPAV